MANQMADAFQLGAAMNQRAAEIAADPRLSTNSNPWP